MSGTRAGTEVATNRQVLAVPAFRRLAVIWFLTNLGDSSLYITAAIWVRELTGSDAAAGLVFAALGLPALVAPLSGHLADRVRRRPLLMATNAGAGLLVLLLLAVGSPSRVWLVYVVIALYAMTSYVTTAAQSGILRSLLADRFLAPANGLLSSLDQGLRTISPLIGAAVFAVWGMTPVILLTSGCFLLAAVSLLTLRVEEAPPAPDPGEGFWRSTTAGLRFLAAHPFLRPATLSLAIAIGATGVINITNFATIDQGLGLPVEMLSVAVSVQGVCSVAGGLTASMVIRRVGVRRTMVMGLLLLAVGVGGLATSSVPVVVLSVACVGFGLLWAIVAFVTTRQQSSPDHLQGRTAAASTMLFNVPQVAATLLAAVLIGSVDYRVLVIGTAVVGVTGVLPLALLRDARPGAGRGPRGRRG